MNNLFNRPFHDLPSVDEVVQETMQWHFSPETGSPFWLEYQRNLEFDPRKDIRTREDLKLFPDVSALWKDIPVEDLLPKGCRNDPWAFQVFESGGTTGAPKRIIEANSRRRGVEWVNHVLDLHGVPERGHWLHIGPAGPHAVGRSVGVLAHLRKSLGYFVDFDPRWVKRLIREGRKPDVALYVDHVIEQAVTILESQPVSFIFATPPVLEAVAKKSHVLELFRKRAKVVIWSGTSASQETLHLIEEELFPEAKVLGLYGNTMMGIAPQRPRTVEDQASCVFQTFYPYCFLDVVDPNEPTVHVPYGERGQVKVTLMSREIFLPNNLERDVALREKPTADFPWDGVSNVGVLQTTKQETIIEGVY